MRTEERAKLLWTRPSFSGLSHLAAPPSHLCLIEMRARRLGTRHPYLREKARGRKNWQSVKKAEAIARESLSGHEEGMRRRPVFGVRVQLWGAEMDSADAAMRNSRSPWKRAKKGVGKSFLGQA